MSVCQWTTININNNFMDLHHLFRTSHALLVFALSYTLLIWCIEAIFKYLINIISLKNWNTFRKHKFKASHYKLTTITVTWNGGYSIFILVYVHKPLCLAPKGPNRRACEWTTCQIWDSSDWISEQNIALCVGIFAQFEAS